MTISTTSSESQGHIVFFAYEAWGHTRPLCVLAERIVKTKPLHITFFTVPSFRSRVEDELTRNFEAEDAHLRKLIRVVALDTGDSATIFDVETLNFSFALAYERLVLQAPVKCVQSGAETDPLPSPDAVLLDFFCLNPLQSVRKLSKKSVKVLAWYSGAASFIFYPFAPESKGGRGDFRPAVFEESAKTGRSIEEVADEVIFRVEGTVVRIPGLPPMYDHEHHPQETIFKGPVGSLWINLYGMLETCDGIILSTPEYFEPEGVAAIRDWFSEASRDVHVIGPLLPIGKRTAVSGENKQSENATEIQKFLESTLESHGPESMLYISFGSVFWSTEPDKIWAFLDVVMEKKIPFIMSHASPFAQVPEAVKEKVASYGLGLLSPWSPQQTILAHPVTGWFVTHGGQNSVVESICFGKPMICWPFHADQPLNAVHLVENLDVAYELLEVRNGHGLKEIHRLGKTPVGTIAAVREEASRVLSDALGDDGKRKRANMKKLQEVVLNSWHPENGPAQKSIEVLVSSFQA